MQTADAERVAGAFGQLENSASWQAGRHCLQISSSSPAPPSTALPLCWPTLTIHYYEPTKNTPDGPTFEVFGPPLVRELRFACHSAPELAVLDPLDTGGWQVSWRRPAGGEPSEAGACYTVCLLQRAQLPAEWTTVPDIAPARVKVRPSLGGPGRCADERKPDVAVRPPA